MIGIIAAMNIEVESLKAHIENAVETMVSGTRFLRGMLYGKEVVCAVCGIGKVNAAVCTQSMILTFHPDYIINTGVGGALTGEYRVCDVVIGVSAVQHDMDTSPLGDEVGFVSTVNLTHFPLDEALNLRLKAALTDLGLNVRRGVIATGDQFIAAPQAKKAIHERFGATVCEMEGCAIAHTCYLNRVPCAILRAISDGAGEDAHLTYAEFAQIAADNSAKALMRFVEAHAD